MLTYTHTNLTSSDTQPLTQWVVCFKAHIDTNAVTHSDTYTYSNARLCNTDTLSSIDKI